MKIPVQKVRMTEIKPGDWKTMHDAVYSYLHAIADHYHSEQKSQQLIHYTILDIFSWELHKRIYSRKPAKQGQLTLEMHTAFVLFDALCFFSNQCDNHLQCAVLNRLMISLHSELPRTSDGKKLSIHSNLDLDQ